MKDVPGQLSLSQVDPVHAQHPMLVVVLSSGRRIAVEGGFEDAVLVARLATMLEESC